MLRSMGRILLLSLLCWRQKIYIQIRPFTFGAGFLSHFDHFLLEKTQSCIYKRMYLMYIYTRIHIMHMQYAMCILEGMLFIYKAYFFPSEFIICWKMQFFSSWKYSQTEDKTGKQFWFSGTTPTLVNHVVNQNCFQNKEEENYICPVIEVAKLFL